MNENLADVTGRRQSEHHRYCYNNHPNLIGDDIELFSKSKVDTCVKKVIVEGINCQLKNFT